MKTHKHHIIPKHAGGTDDPSNLVELTIEEHAEAHRLLFDEHGRWQDEVAWKVLSGQMNMDESKEYARRKAIGDYFRGRVRPQHEKDKIRESMMGKNKGKKYGPRTFTDEHKKNLSKAHNRKPRGQALKSGWKQSDEAKRKISEASKRMWAERKKNETI